MRHITSPLSIILIFIGLISVLFIGIGAKGCSDVWWHQKKDNSVAGSSSGGQVTDVVAPSNLAANPASSTAVALTWTDNSYNESGFVIERKTGLAGVYASIATPDANSTVYTDTPLASATIYYYRIKAFNPLFEKYSNEVSTMTYGVWSTTNPTGAPAARYNPVAVFANTNMIVWGGYEPGNYLTSGGVYNPTLDSWTPTAAVPPGFSGRLDCTTIWTGSQMLIWGGHIYSVAEGKNVPLPNGSMYNPLLDTWTAMDESVPPVPVSRTGQSAVWTGNSMIVWGGYDGSVCLKSGAVFDPNANAWIVILPDPPATIDARRWHTAVWTGAGSEPWRHRMIIWGGTTGSVYLSNGGFYDMETSVWFTLPTANAPSARARHTVIWTGSKMIVWGGINEQGYLNTGGVYDPATNTWAPMSTVNAPIGRMDHTAIWTGNVMIVWGGGIAPGTTTGGIYDPQTDTWYPTPTTGAPAQRGKHTAVWDNINNFMIIWGGWDGATYFDTGGRYTAP